MNKFNSSYTGLRPDLLKYITGHSNKVLDVGCASGSNGRFMIENDIADTVYGIEYNKEMASVAKQHITKVFQGDLNSNAFVSEITNLNTKFDYIIFGDILEHLIEPLHVLSQFKSLLKNKGKIIISLPNIAHVELFIQVYIKGTWPKNNRGIFDRTHLRWFTRKDVFKLLNDADLNLVVYERKFRSRDALGSTFNWKYSILKKLNKDWVTFQHIVVCSNEK